MVGFNGCHNSIRPKFIPFCGDDAHSDTHSHTLARMHIRMHAHRRTLSHLKTEQLKHIC